MTATSDVTEPVARMHKPATMAQALNRALSDAMAEGPLVHVLGEDVGTLGGVFRITDGLAEQFGQEPCTDTPLAGAGILGTAVGWPCTDCGRLSRCSSTPSPTLLWNS